MARQFDGTTGWLEGAAAPVIATPLTMFVRFKTPSSAQQNLLQIVEHQLRQGWHIWLDAGKVVARTLSTTGSAAAVTTTSYALNAWQSALAEFASDSARSVRLNNGGEGTNAAAISVGLVNRTMLGARYFNSTSPSLFFSGALAAPAIWSGLLTEEEKQALAEGVDPLLIRPDILAFSPEMFGRASPEGDRISGMELAVNGGVTQVAHPRMIWAGRTSHVLLLPEATSPPPPPPPLGAPLTADDNEVLSLLSYEEPYQEAVPVGPGDLRDLNKGEKQFLAHGFAGIPWGGIEVPAEPTDLVATAVAGTQINLAWVAPVFVGDAPITGYKIERESPVGGGWTTLVADTGSTTTSYSDTGLTLGTVYNYRVSAINLGGAGLPSNEAFALTFNVPDAPTGLVAAADGTDEIDLTWVAPAVTGGLPIIGYKIERESPVGGGWITRVANTGSTAVSFTDVGLTHLTQYNYRVSAINSLGAGPASAAAHATTLDIPHPTWDRTRYLQAESRTLWLR